MTPIESDLIRTLYDGVFEQPSWGNFLEKLRACVGARHTTLTFRAFTDDAIVELHSGQALPAALRQFVDKLHAKDPHLFQDMEDGRVYPAEALLDSDDPDPKIFCQALLDNTQIGYIGFIRTTEPSGVQIWLSCAGEKNDEAAANAIMTWLEPHLRAALRTYVVLEQQKQKSALTYEASLRFNFGWLTLDATSHIVDLMPEVEQVLRRAGMLHSDQQNCPVLRTPGMDREISALVKRFAADATSKPRALTLSRDPWIDMLVAPVQNRPITSKTKPVAILYLRIDRSSQEDRYSQLAELFGLLHSEAKLAWSIAQGMSIAEAAEYLGITCETARYYSKKVFAKTGTRGQAELVRAVLTSVLALN